TVLRENRLRFRPELILLEDRCVLSPLFTEFPVPADGFPGSSAVETLLTSGADGNLWFALGSDKIARMTPKGVTTTFEVPKWGGRINPAARLAIDDISNLISGPDGNIWFVDS